MTDFLRQRELMVENQLRARGITEPTILEAFRTVPREEFVPPNLREFAYHDGPLPIGEGQTISQPYIVAAMIAAARIGPKDKVLEVGAGSGYAAAVLSLIAARVFAIERHEALAHEARERIERLGYANCTIVAGDGMLGLPDQAPFDAILVAAQGQEVPKALLEQLAIGGRLVIPIGDETMQRLTLIIRRDGEGFETQELDPVRFVPLVPGAVPSRKGAEPRAAKKKSLSQVIADHADPLPELDDPDFPLAFDRFADKRIVMLGECSHGTHEFYQARAAITRHLVEKHGFTIVAVEADWPDAAAFNRYINLREIPETMRRPFQRFPTWMWRNSVMPGLLADLRAINQARDERERVGFYGLDLYNMAASIEATLAYLDAHDKEAARIARERYGCLAPFEKDPAAYGRMALSEGFARCEEPVVRQLSDMLERVIADDPDSFDAAMNARLIASAERYYRVMYYGGADSWNLRDAHMAETLEWLMHGRGEDARGSKAKAIVWAHNSHIGDARAGEMGQIRGEHNLGQLARERWGDEVALIGFGTHSGTVTAASEWNGEHEFMTVRPSRPDSYERLCHDSGVERFLLVPKADEDLAGRLAKPRLERFIGVIYRPQTERWSHYSHTSLPDQFDAYVWFDRTRALLPLSEAEPHEGIPETYPFGL